VAEAALHGKINLEGPQGLQLDQERKNETRLRATQLFIALE